ncbi:MAG: sigma-70 family RNA polymerase sigma factor [Proteobacteria bacterium]|nr:sigma-70 family RNA polymerase sigma factor [Pseudomonadota bacterium]
MSDSSAADAQHGNVMVWLLTIAYSRALDYLRKADDAELCEEPEVLLLDEPSHDGDPQDLLAATQHNLKLNQTLQQLDGTAAIGRDGFLPRFDARRNRRFHRYGSVRSNRISGARSNSCTMC